MEGCTEGSPIPLVLVRLRRYYCYRLDNQYSHLRDQQESNPSAPLFSPLHTNSTQEYYSASINITSSVIHPSRRTRWAISWCTSHSSYHPHYAPVEQCVEVAAGRSPPSSILFPLFQAMAKLPVLARSAIKKPNENMRLIVVTIVGAVFGFFIGISFPTVSITKLHFPSSIVSYIEDKNSGLSAQAILNHAWTAARNAREDGSGPVSSDNFNFKIYVPTNPRGAESLAPGIVVPESDFHQHRLWGDPEEDLPFKPKYLVTFTVGVSQKDNINRAVKKFSKDFAILLFHYDGRVTEWDEFEWSKRAIHVSVRRQAKWWYAKRFLHPDIVAAYEYVFIWDEDLGVDHFNGDEYIKLVKKYRLEISQPGLEPDRELTWQMTKRRGDRQVHMVTEEREGWCSNPHVPPCAGFVEIMAPVFSRDAWRCVWHMIQNDLVHGWGLDFALRKCVEPAHEKIGVVDSQWIVHQVVPSLGNQGQAENGRAPWEGVRERCRKEWALFQTRMAEAEKAYYEMMGVTPPNVTFVS